MDKGYEDTQMCGVKVKDTKCKQLKTYKSSNPSQHSYLVHKKKANFSRKYIYIYTNLAKPNETKVHVSYTYYHS